MASFVFSRARAAGFFLALFPLFLAACGGGGSGPTEVADTTPPSVKTANPVDGATDVAPNTPIAVSFSEALRCGATQTGTFGTVSGTLSCVNAGGAGLMTLVPSAPLGYDVLHTFTLSGYQDQAGNVGQAFTSSFRTARAPDAAAPRLLSVSVADGATGVPIALPAITFTFDEEVRCAGQPTLQSAVYTVSGTTACTGKTLVFTPASADKAFYGTEHTLAIPAGAVTDASGNAAAAYAGRFTTERLPGGTRLYTANSGAKPDNGQHYVSEIDVTAGYAMAPVLITGPSSHQSFVAPDPATGKVYSSGYSSFRGIDVIDTVADTVTSFQLDPDPNTAEYIDGLAVGPHGVYVAYSNYWGYPLQPSLRNRILRFDRRTGRELVRSAAFPDDTLTPMAVIAHPDPAVKRLYVLSAAKSALDVLSLQCGWYSYRSGTLGLVTELHAETLATLRTFTVGSVPFAAALDSGTGRLYVGNAGDRSLSSIDLVTGAVTTVQPPTLMGCRQPVALSLGSDGKLLVANAFDGLHTFDAATFTEIAFVSTGTKSLPYGVAVVGTAAYVPLAWNNVTAVPNNVVVEIIGSAVTRTITVGPQPMAITVLRP